MKSVYVETSIISYLTSRPSRDLARGSLAGQPISQLVLADQAAPPADLLADTRVSARVGPLLDQCAALAEEPVEGIFHLASAVSGECEADFDLGMRSNLDSTRALLEALRARQLRHGMAARLVFSSSVAVFGPDASVPMPPVVAVSASSGGGAQSPQTPPRDRIELSAAAVAGPGPATGGQKKAPQLQLPPQELRARMSK
jgi:nucleoside-diphosphate-sugar epimerase